MVYLLKILGKVYTPHTPYPPMSKLMGIISSDQDKSTITDLWWEYLNVKYPDNTPKGFVEYINSLGYSATLLPYEDVVVEQF